MNKEQKNEIADSEEYKLLMSCIDKKITQSRCGLLLNLSVRQIKRKCSGLKQYGANSLIHKNTGKISSRRINDGLRMNILRCCNNEFIGYGPTLVSEEYGRMYGTKLAVETVRQIMIGGGVWVHNRKVVRRIHNLRERMSCYGEMVQADGTEYDWLGDGNKYIMLVFIDDATSSLLHAILVKSESRSSYMQAMNGYLLKHGRPMCLYTDKHGVFRVNMPSALEDSQTQFARAMDQLGIKMIQAHSAQAKGRVERANRTLQDRFTKRLRLQGIKTLEEANKYLQDEYIAEYNAKFAVVPSSPINVHRPLEDKHNLEQILALHDTRVISKNHTFQYDNQVVQILDDTTLNLHKKEVKIISKNDEITHVIVADRLVQFRALKIRAKQSDVACVKMINLAVKDARERIIATGQNTVFGKALAVCW